METSFEDVDSIQPSRGTAERWTVMNIMKTPQGMSSKTELHI